MYTRMQLNIQHICDISSHATRNAQRGGKCRKNADGDLKNGLPCVCFHFTHIDSILKVKLNILCVSHEVNFPLGLLGLREGRLPRQLHSGGGEATSIRSLHRRPVQCRPYCRRLGWNRCLGWCRRSARCYLLQECRRLG